MSTRDWTQIEVEATVASYMAMLSAELRGETYNKSEYRRNLQTLLNNRSDGAIEMKHQNISAILVSMEMPYIKGYKPLYNYQKRLFDTVAEVVNNDQTIIQSVNLELEKPITIPTVEDILGILEDPPIVSSVKEELASYGAKRKPVKIDFLKKESRNQQLGRAGEEFVLHYEKAWLIHHGKEKLSDKVEYVADYDDTAGFDIRSFDDNGKDRFIEVKTTTCGKEFPFYLSNNEVLKSIEQSDNYFLYRLFNFRENPRMYQLQGALEKTCHLKPVSYIASVA